MISRLSLLPRLLIVFVVCVCCGACELDCADTAPTTVRVPPVQIAFGIMIYQKSGRSVASVLYDFHNLMEVIYTAHNHLYVLHVDVKSDPALIGRYGCFVLDRCLRGVLSRNAHVSVCAVAAFTTTSVKRSQTVSRLCHGTLLGPV